MEKMDISRREFLERMGLLGGLGAAYYGMAQFALPPLSYAHSGAPKKKRVLRPFPLDKCAWVVYS